MQPLDTKTFDKMIDVIIDYRVDEAVKKYLNSQNIYEFKEIIDRIDNQDTTDIKNTYRNHASLLVNINQQHVSVLTKDQVTNIVVGVPRVVSENSEAYDVVLAYRKYENTDARFGVDVCHISQLATDAAFRFSDEQLGELIAEIRKRYNASLSQTYVRTIANSVVEAPEY